MTFKSHFQIFCWVLFLSSCCLPDFMHADDCKKLIDYSSVEWKIQLPAIHGQSLGSFGRQRLPAESASAFAQLFDFYQYATCKQLNRLKPGTPEWYSTVQKSLEATTQLTQLMVLLTPSTDQHNATQKPDAAIAQYVSQSVPAARDALTLLSTPEGQKAGTEFKIDPAKLNPLLNQLAADLQSKLQNKQEDLRTESPIRTWDLIKRENKDKLLEQMGRIAEVLGPALGISVPELRTYIFMNGGDGHLYVPDHPTLGTAGIYPRPDPEPIRIPYGYGFTGVAYQTKEKQYGCLGREGESVTFMMGQHPEAKISQMRARRVLLEPPIQPLPTARWVMAIPLISGDNINAVLTISSDVAPKAASSKCNQDDYEQLLSDAYNQASASLNQAVNTISDLLTLKP